jgi:ABC-2 type transport system ATP-binding protein
MLSIKDVTYGYTANYKVLSNFSLEFSEGGIYGLLGKNGTGKSTLLYLIMGLLHPNKGEVLYNGVDTRLRNPDIMSDMFIVPEEYNLPAISLKEYINSLRRFYPRFSEDTLKRCLDGFGMPLDVNLGALSMGQKKKVYMCMALAANTGLLLMDEPTNGLDIPSKSQFRNVVANNMTDDRTIIISTHQVRDVELLLDRLAVIDQNRVLLDATMGEISDKLRFVDVDRNSLSAEALYYEDSVHGYSAVMKKTADLSETCVNLELLFNALLTDSKIINDVLNGKK